MRKILVLTILIICCGAGSVSAGGQTVLALHATGYGPVEIGMTVEAASAALRKPLMRDSPSHPFDADCYYVCPDGNCSSIGFMVHGGLITRIDVWDASIPTTSGITVGSSEEVVKKQYGTELREEEHEYLGQGGKYLSAETAGGNVILFETAGESTMNATGMDFIFNNFQVIKYRLGRPSSVSLVEGCF